MRIKYMLLILLMVTAVQSFGQANCVISFIDKNNSPVSGLIATIAAGKTIGRGEITNGKASVPLAFPANYTGPVKLTDSCTIKAISVLKGWEDSDIVTGTYEYFFGTLPTPRISLSPGTYQSPREITISRTQEGAQLYYSTGASFIEYSAPLTLIDSVTLSAYAKKKYYGDSLLSQVQLTINKRDLTNKIIDNPSLNTPEWVIWQLFDAADKDHFDEFVTLLCHEDLCYNQSAITTLQQYNWQALKRDLEDYRIDPTSITFMIIRTIPSELSGLENEVVMYVDAGDNKMPVSFELKKDSNGNYKLTGL